MYHSMNKVLLSLSMISMHGSHHLSIPAPRTSQTTKHRRNHQVTRRDIKSVVLLPCTTPRSTTSSTTPQSSMISHRCSGFVPNTIGNARSKRLCILLQSELLVLFQWKYGRRKYGRRVRPVRPARGNFHAVVLKSIGFAGASRS